MVEAWNSTRRKQRLKTREMERALAVADPVGGGRLDGLDFKAMEGELLADLDDEQPAPSQPGP